eukprot:jgi/Tetstr1/453516/TSEL_040484.t1
MQSLREMLPVMLLKMPSGTTMTWDKGVTDADVANTDASPTLVSPEAEAACEDGIGDGHGPRAGQADHYSLDRARMSSHRPRHSTRA